MINETVRAQYELEKKLAQQLHVATSLERKTLYTKTYDELFRQFPYLRTEDSEIKVSLSAKKKARLIYKFINKNSIFLELGSGTCHVSRHIAKRIKKVYAVDVSKEAIDLQRMPPNFEFILSDGTDIPLNQDYIDVVYSNHLMEHLHPTDAIKQLKSIYAVLKSGGKYICVTPNRVIGPHDVSKYFDDISTGLHLKEYSVQDLVEQFSCAGFSEINFFAGGKGFYIRFPIKLIIVLEKLYSKFPKVIRKKLSNYLLLKALFGANIVAIKG